MSDQPDDRLEQHIPGLRQAIARLSALTAAAGFHLNTIVITHQPPQDGAPPAPTRIHLAPMATTAQPSDTWLSPTSQHLQWRPGEPLPSLAHIQSAEPHQMHQQPQPPPTTASTTSQVPSPPSSRPKRASASILETTDHQSSPVGKRKRFSDPAEPLPGLTSAAFWGTVLEERPGAPAGMMPSQIPHLQPQPLGPQPSQRVIHPMPPPPHQPHLLHQQQPGEHLHPPQPEQEHDRVHRSQTLPALRLRSPITSRQRNILPSLNILPEQMAVTAAAAYAERQPSPEISASAQIQPQPGRGLLRRAAGQLFSRLSPFRGEPFLSLASASRPLPEEQLFQQRQHTTSALPAIVPTPQRPAPELLAPQPPRDRPFEVHQLPPLQGYHPQPPIGQHSGSRSASGSGVSHAHTARNTISPQAIAEGSRPLRSETVSRGKRGRRAAATPDREVQFFECDQCDSKFKRKSDKNRHVRVVHEKSRPFTCPVCRKTFGEKSNMLKHRTSVHDDVRTFRCPYCEQSFSQRGLCDTHVRTVHDKKQAKYFCEHCGLPFSRKVQLHEHYDTVHPEYMAAYGRFQMGQPSGVQATTTTAGAAQQETARDRAGPAPAVQQFVAPAPEVPAQTRQDTVGLQRFEPQPPQGAGPSDPRHWAQYPPSSQPPASNEVQQIQQIQQKSPRPRSFQDDTSGGSGA